MFKRCPGTLVVGTLMAALVGCSVFGGRGPTVDTSDLARLSAEGVESLKPTESEVFAAKVDLERAEQKLVEAEKRVDEVDRRVKVEKLDLKAAKAEVKAAKANEDRARIDRAEADKASAEQALEQDRRRLQEAREAREMAQAVREAAEAKLALARARREAARARQLLDEGVVSSDKLDLEKFEQRVAEAAKRYEKRARQANIDPPS